MSLEQIRPYLLAGLGLVLILLWQAWQRDYPARVPAVDVAETTQGGADPAVQPDLPPSPQSVTAGASAPVPTLPTMQAPVSQAPSVLVETDLISARISLDGGDLRNLELLRYPVSLEQPDKAFHLLQERPDNFFIAQSGLLAANGAPNHHSRFVADREDYRLADGADELRVRLDWQSDTGLRASKTYIFHRGSYLVDVLFQVENASGAPWSGRMYGQFQRGIPEDTGGRFIYTYTGGVFSSEEKPYEKVDFDDMAAQDVGRSVTGGWAAMIQHYFAAAWIPDNKASNHYYTKALPDSRYVLGVISPERVVSPGTTEEFRLKTYVGPKLQDRLEQAAPGLERTVDYGWLFFIAQPIYWLLSLIHGVIGNWGWAIILVTVVIKGLFFKLSAASYRSMAKMRKFQPRMVELKERFGGDRAKLNQAMMELYKKEKINPLGGCLPILVQIPVFISLYWVLLESVELRQADFMLWVHDLSAYDPYYVLPILMGISMLIQQKLNPKPPDPVQAKVMMALPFIFTFMFLNFPSGLVLYWFVNNVLSITQQWVITRRIEAQPA